MIKLLTFPSCWFNGFLIFTQSSRI